MNECDEYEDFFYLNITEQPWKLIMYMNNVIWRRMKIIFLSYIVLFGARPNEIFSSFYFMLLPLELFLSL